MHLGRRKVSDPNGNEWRVGRRWLPDRPRLRRRRNEDTQNTLDAADAGWDIGDIFDAPIVAFIGLAILVVTFILFPFIVLLIELIVFVVVAAGGLVLRAVAGRPWVVRARSRAGHEHRWDIVGFRAAGEYRDTVARRLEQTGRPDE